MAQRKYSIRASCHTGTPSSDKGKPHQKVLCFSLKQNSGTGIGTLTEELLCCHKSPFYHSKVPQNDLSFSKSLSALIVYSGRQGARTLFDAAFSSKTITGLQQMF